MEEKVREILDRNFNSSNYEIDSLGQHASHKTFSAVSDKRDFVVKICDDDWSGLPDFEKGFELDAPVLKLVKEKTSIPVPEVYAYDNSETEFDFKYIVMEKIEGDSMYGCMNYPKQKHLIKNTGELLGGLHNNIEFQNFGALSETQEETIEVEPATWSSMFRQLMWKLTNHLERLEAEDMKNRIRQVVQENLHLIESREDSVLVHQEFSPRNMVGTTKSINAIIDWERSISGDPEYDLFTTEKHILQKEVDKPGIRENAEEVRKTLYEGYTSKRSLEDGWKERRNLYHLPYITIMMYVMRNKETNSIRPRLIEQLEKVEENL